MNNFAHRRLGRPWILICITILCACTVVQVGLGVDLRVLLLALGIVAIGIAAVVLFGFGHLGALLVLLFCFNNAFWGIILKTIFLQTLDSNLLAPVESFTAVFLAAFGFLSALLLVSSMNVGRTLLASERSQKTLGQLVIYAAVVGIGLWIAHRYLFVDTRSASFEKGESFGGFGVFQNLIYFAIICATTKRIYATDGKSTLGISVLLLLATCLFMSLVDNDKRVMAFGGLAYLFPSIYVRSKVTRQQLLAGCFGLALIVLVVAPLTQALRVLGIRGMSLPERIGYLVDEVPKLLQPNNGQTLADAVVAAEGGYVRYFGDDDPFMIGRFVSLQYIDPVIAAVDRSGTFQGGWIPTEALLSLLPSVIYPQKSTVSVQDRISWRLGLRTSYVVGYPVVPLVADSYATYGLITVCFEPFLVFFILLLTMKKIGWTLKHNVFSMFFLVQLTLSSSSLGIQQWASFFGRNVIVLVATLLLFRFLSRRRLHFAQRF